MTVEIIGHVNFPTQLRRSIENNISRCRINNSQCQITCICNTACARSRKVSYAGVYWAHSIVVPSVTHCRCCCGHRCAGGVRKWRRVTVATPGEWQCKTGGVWRLAVANGPNIFQMLLVYLKFISSVTVKVRVYRVN